MQGFLIFVFLVAVVWIGGCALEGYNKMQRGQIYKEVWKKAPELERVHGGLSAELARLHDFRKQLERNQRLFESPAAKAEAGRKITAVDAQIARLEAQRLAIVSSVEQQALTNVSSKVENPMQREMIARLESETQSVTSDAESLRQEIEAGVSGDPLSYVESPSPSRGPLVDPPETKVPRPSDLGGDPLSYGESPSRSRGALVDPPETKVPRPPDLGGDPADDLPGPAAGRSAGKVESSRKIRSAARLFEPRVWNDRYGHRVSARLLHVADRRGYAVATLGVDPADIAASDWVVHLQRQDGAIIQVPAVKFSSRDLDFLAEGG